MITHAEKLRPSLCGVNFGPAAIFFAGFLWACDGIFRPSVSTRLNAEAVVAWEHIFSLLPLFPLIYRFFVKERKTLGIRQWLLLIVVGVGSDAIANILITLGYSSGHLALVALLQQSQPVFGLLAAYLILGEDFRSRVAIPLSTGAFIGLFLMMWPYVREARQEKSSNTLDGMKAVAYGMGAAIIWASETVISRWLLHYSTPALTSVELLTYRQFIGLVFLVTYTFVLSAPPLCNFVGLECLASTQPNPWQAFIICVMALLEIVSHTVYYMGLNNTPASVAVIMELSNPLLILTVIPTLTSLLDPEYVRVSLESEQIAGAIVLTLSTTLLGVYSAMSELQHAQKSPIPSATEDMEMMLMDEAPSENDSDHAEVSTTFLHSFAALHRSPRSSELLRQKSEKSG